MVQQNHPLIPRGQKYILNRKLVSIHSYDRDIKKWPNNMVSKDLIEFTKELKKIRGENDTIVFRIDNDSLQRYPQIDPRTEYYMDMPVLSFKKIED